MAIAPSSISTSLIHTRNKPYRFIQFPHSTVRSTLNRSSQAISSLSSSSSSSSEPLKPLSNKPDLEYEEFLHQTPLPRNRNGSFVYVTLPVNATEYVRNKRKMKILKASLRALATAGVEGVVMEIYWGLVEKDEPGCYDWDKYLVLVDWARDFGLKVRAVFGFHEHGEAGEIGWVPLPYWVREAMIDDPDLTHSDRFGRRNKEYISLACDNLPLLKGRSPIQAYSDIMRSFRDTFKEYLGMTVTGVQVGMGPAGELRYPLCPSQKLDWSWRVRELGEFQCYDKHMLASLSASAREIGKPEWGTGGPLGTGNLMHIPEETEFFKSNGYWDSPYGRFFLEWYSGMLLLHGERLCIAAENIFFGRGVSTFAKLAVMHWHYATESHPSELTAGYYNTSIRDGYLPIARLFARYGMILCCNSFELRDANEILMHSWSSPEKLLLQIMLAARASDLPFDAGNSAEGLNAESLNQIVKMSKFYSDGLDDLVFSFNFTRLNQNLFEPPNWSRFCEFVKQISPSASVQAQLKFGGSQSCATPAAAAKMNRSAGAYC